MQIAQFEISARNRPFIIAEMSGNHNQNLDRALKIVEAAADAGVHALKIQTYTADTMTLDLDQDEFFITDSNSLWKGQSMYSLYQRAHTPWEWHEAIFKKARDAGLLAFSAPFDDTAVDFLEQLGVPCYKIASFECVDLPLIKKVALTGKPIILSTGSASVSEIAEAVDTARAAGCKDIVLLKCTSTYPASPENSNLLTLPHMKELFNCEIGLSDHTMGIGAAVASVSLGASVIEKHFTLSRMDGGVDSAFSLEPEEMKTLVEETGRAWQATGEVKYGPTREEQKARMRRRSLYIAEDMQPGDVLTPRNLRRIRPGYGLSPKYYEVLLGKKVSIPLKKGTPLDWSIIG